MSLLTGLDKLISDVAGPLVFQRASLLRGSGYSISAATGQMVNSQTTEDIQVIEADYTDRHRASLDIPDQDRRLSILGYGVTTPRPGDRVSVRGFIWEIVNIARDPAGALYDCQVKPITDDLAGDPGATANLLSGVAGLVSNVAGPLLFGNAVIFRVLTSTLDASGQSIRTTDIEFIKALEVEYSAFHRTDAGIPDTDRSLLILAQGLTAIPKPGDRVDIKGLKYEIVRTGRDPARALYECQARPVGVAEILILAQHNVTLARQQLYATGERKFVFHAGVLARVIGEASGYTVGGASTENTLARIIGTALAIAPVTASSDGLLARVYFGGSCALGASIEAGTVTGRAILSGAVSVLALASHAATTGRAILAAAASLAEVRSAAHAGTLGRMTGAANAEALTGAAGAATLARLDMAGSATNAATAQSEGITSRAGLMAACDNLVVAVHPGTTGRAQGAGAATNATGAAQAATLGRATLGALGGALAAGAHAGALARAIFAGTATVVAPLEERTATHAGTLARLAGEATAQSFNTAALASTLARIISTGTATLATSATQAATLARLLSTTSGDALLAASHAGTLARGVLDATATSTAAELRSYPVYQSFDDSENTYTVNKPPGTVEGDLLVGVFYDDALDQTINAPAGWTVIGTQFGDGLMNGKVAYKLAGASEPASYTWSITGSRTYQFGDIFRFDNFDPANPIGNSSFNGGVGTVRTINGVTTDYDHSKLFIASIARVSGQSAIPDATTRNTHYGSHAFADQDVLSAGAVASRTVTHSSSNSWGTAIVVINGLPSVGGLPERFALHDETTAILNSVEGSASASVSIVSTQTSTLSRATMTATAEVTGGGLIAPTVLWSMGGSNASGTGPAAFPSSLSEGDVVLFAGYSDSSAQMSNSPTGYTQLYRAFASSVGATIAYKVMGATPDSILSGHTGNGTTAWIAVAFRGVDGTIFDVPLTGVAQGTTLTANPPAITTTSENALILALSFLDDDRQEGATTPPSGYTLIIDREADLSGSGTVAAASLVAVTPGTYDPGTFGGGNDAWNAFTLALKGKPG